LLEETLRSKKELSSEKESCMSCSQLLLEWNCVQVWYAAPYSDSQRASHGPSVIVGILNIPHRPWYSASGAIGKWQNLWEVGPSRRKLGHWGYAIEGNNGTLAPSLLSPCFLDSMK
jgi:hypothetical protein